MKLKRFIIILVLAVSVLVSYFYSKEVYTFYLRMYYNVYKGYSYYDMLTRSRQLLHEGKEAELLDYTQKLYLLYPRDNEVMLIRGLALLQKGDDELGLSLIAIALENAQPSDQIFNQVISLMYQRGFFGEIISAVRKRKDLTAETSFYYGVSLFKKGYNKEAIEELTGALRKGKKDAVTYYYLSMAYKGTGDYKNALLFMEYARDRNATDRAIEVELVALYRKLGMMDKAERTIRQSRFIR